MRIEIEMSEKFRDYCIKNVPYIQAQKMVSELLKDEHITKPYKQAIKDTCIAELKYSGHKITGAAYNVSRGIIFLDIANQRG